MMVKLVDHLVQGLHIDIEKRKQDNAEKQRLETQLYKLLTELVETERKYVKDLEKVIFKLHTLSCIYIGTMGFPWYLRVDDANDAYYDTCADKFFCLLIKYTTFSQLMFWQHFENVHLPTQTLKG